MVLTTSTFEWRLSKPMEFVGFANYIKAFSDPNVRVAVGHTLIWVLLQMTVHVALGTLLAFILAERFCGWKAFRTICMLPNVISTAALGMILINVFKTDGGYAGVALSYIRAIQTGVPTEMIFCVANNGAIAGLRDDDVVEISSTIHPDGSYTPHKVSDPAELPMELIRRVKMYERYASKAIRNRSVNDAVDCLMVHPLVNSYSLAEELVEAYIKSNKDFIEGWH